MARTILGVFEVFLGLFAKTKEKKDRAICWDAFEGEGGRGWGGARTCDSLTAKEIRTPLV